MDKTMANTGLDINIISYQHYNDKTLKNRNLYRCIHEGGTGHG